MVELSTNYDIIIILNSTRGEQHGLLRVFRYEHLRRE